MLTLRTSCLALVAGLTLVACTPTVDPAAEQQASSRSVPVTVSTFTGTVEPAGISIYMEGTHRLVLSDGRFILLESELVNLKSYEGKSVEVTGRVRATEEEGGRVMTVDRLDDLALRSSESSESSASSETTTSSSSSSETSVSTSSSSSSVVSISTTSSSVSVPAVSSSVSSSVSKASVVSSASISSVASSVVSSSSATSVSVSVSSASVSSVVSSTGPDPRVAKMASQASDLSRWTSQYCFKSFPVCLSLHAFWTYDGTFAPAGRHLEIASGPIELKGDGVLVVAILDGTLAERGVSDGQVVILDGRAMGYRDVNGKALLQVSGPAELQAAIQTLLEKVVLSPAA